MSVASSKTPAPPSPLRAPGLLDGAGGDPGVETWDGSRVARLEQRAEQARVQAAQAEAQAAVIQTRAAQFQAQADQAQASLSEAVLMIFELRGIRVAELDRLAIQACREGEVLTRWLRQARTAESAAALLRP